MKNQENQPLEIITDAVQANPQSTIPKVYENPRQVAYSYLLFDELLKVATLSKKERETVLNSKIVRENRKKEENLYFLFGTFKLKSYCSDVAVKGLLIAVEFSTVLDIRLKCEDENDEKRFKYLFPAMIAAAVRGGTELELVDRGNEHLNEFAANEIEKAGVHIDQLHIKSSVNFCRMIGKAKKVEFGKLKSSNYAQIKQLIESYTELPHLKELSCSPYGKEGAGNDLKVEIIYSILARSQLEEFVTGADHNETELLKLLAKQTQLKNVIVYRYIDDVEVFFTSLPKSILKLKFDLREHRRDATQEEQLLLLMLNCNMQHITVPLYQRKKKTSLEEILNRYLDDNQQSESNRRIDFYGWRFNVSANNKILNLQ